MQLTFIIKKIKVAHKLQASNELKNWETFEYCFLSQLLFRLEFYITHLYKY